MCSACDSVCSGENYQVTACSSNTNRVCASCASACASTEYETTACTSTTDRICANCAAVADSTSRTCNAGGAAGITDVTCSSGFYKTGSIGVDLGCTACVAQSNCAISTDDLCSATTAFTDKKPCE